MQINKVWAATLTIAFVAVFNPYGASAQEQLAANTAGERKYDKRIEAAAIKRAGEKIGDLRGSLFGQRTDRIIAPADLKREEILPGFPIMQPETRIRTENEAAVPLV